MSMCHNPAPFEEPAGSLCPAARGRPWGQLLVIFWLLWAAPSFVRANAAQLDTGSTNVNVNVGIFIGINEFSTNEIEKGFPNLRFAVNDAVAYAYLFASRWDDFGLGLIEATNCFLALAGKPTTLEISNQLAELKMHGAVVTGASLTEINATIAQARSRAVDQNGLAVLTLATHGYTANDSAIHGYTAIPPFCVLPSDGIPDSLTDIPAATLVNLLAPFRPAKKLLVFDVCQTRNASDPNAVAVRGPGGADLRDLMDKFKAAKGTRAFYSCSEGESSLESPEMQHGLFSGYLLEALRGKAEADAQGFITVSTAFEYASTNTTQASALRARKQTPFETVSKGTPKDIPLNMKRAELTREVEAAKAVLRASLDPLGDPPLPGCLFDKVCLVFHGAEFRLRSKLAGEIRHRLGPDKSLEGRRDFLGWWADNFTKEPSISNLLFAASQPASPAVATTTTPIMPSNTSDVRGGETTIWTNSLGMVFRRLPSRTNLWLSIWETRVVDYRAFLQASNRTDNLSTQTNEPVSLVNWKEARDFCTWLSEKESLAGAPIRYRLPSDAEWSLAVGLNDSARRLTSNSGNRRGCTYPWGGGWPPPNDAGNYAGKEYKFEPKIEGHRDNFQGLAPVGSFLANTNGFFDLGGNVWEWADSNQNAPGSLQVCRGGGFTLVGGFPANDQLQSSFRLPLRPTTRQADIGFRVVAERP